MKIKSQEIIKGFSPFIVLCILKKQKMSPYSLMKQIEFISDQKFTLKAPSIIEILNSLEDEGLVVYCLGKKQKNVPRKIYSISNKGLQFLDENQKAIDSYLDILFKITR
jgi:DNA-binding PadR family transcriptional regulator